VVPVSLSAVVADEFGEIARRLREIRREEGVEEDDAYHIASGERLDDIAEYHGVEKRRVGETDRSLRERILDKVFRRIIPLSEDS
jgi:hypothetical protein